MFSKQLYNFPHVIPTVTGAESASVSIGADSFLGWSGGLCCCFSTCCGDTVWLLEVEALK